jgi:DNA-binding transcriptional regulator YiaG
MPAIFRFLGSDPLPPAQSLPRRLRSARGKLGLTQRQMAERLGVDPSTLREWEAGEHQPTKGSMDVTGKSLENR